MLLTVTEFYFSKFVVILKFRELLNLIVFEIHKFSFYEWNLRKHNIMSRW